jgi:UDP-glucose 4-epimerase
MENTTLVTGGAGFIGRWLTKHLIEQGKKVVIIDNLSNGSKENIAEFIAHPNLVEFINGDIKDRELIKKLFKQYQFPKVYHLAASINVQDSIDDPETTFHNDVIGTFNVLEEARSFNSRLIFMSTCMVYQMADDKAGISEEHPVKPASPYAGSKLAGENMVLSYYHAYGMPTTIVRPFNTYGPFQKSNLEGGVVSIFIKKALDNETLKIFGDGTQTRDLLYVEDCADFLITCMKNDKTVGQIVNAGLGSDISVNDLAMIIAKDESKIEHVTHHHPQAEIPKLLCNNSKVKDLLGWSAKHTLEQGIEKTRAFLK